MGNQSFQSDLSDASIASQQLGPLHSRAMAIAFASVLSICGATSIHLQASESSTTEAATQIREFPARLDGVSAECDWGLAKDFRLILRIENLTKQTWKQVEANGGCTCVEVKVKELPETGIAPGESLQLEAVYSKPDKPGLSPRTIRLAIDGQAAMVPMLVEWFAPASVRTIAESKQSKAWVVGGDLRKGWSLRDVESANKVMITKLLKSPENGFAVELASDVEIFQRGILRMSLVHDQGLELQQEIPVSLRSSRPRSVPSRLLCDLQSDQTLRGSTRLLFPNGRTIPRPRLTSASIKLPNKQEKSVQIQTQQDLGKIAVKVNFTTTESVDPQRLADAKISFQFDDGSQINCPILISSE